MKTYINGLKPRVLYQRGEMESRLRVSCVEEKKRGKKRQAAIAAVQNKQAVQYGEEELYKVSHPLSSSISRSSVDLVFGDEYP